MTPTQSSAVLMQFLLSVITSSIAIEMRVGLEFGWSDLPEIELKTGHPFTKWNHYF